MRHASTQTHPRRSRELLLAVAAVLLGLLLLETAARVAWTIARDAAGGSEADAAEAGWASLSPELGWEPRPGFRGEVEGARREVDARGYLTLDSAQVGDTAAVTLLFLGDSSTFGWRVAAESTFVERLERSLPGVVAINLGVPGWSSYQGRRALLRRGPEVAPDLLVVSFSFNDRRYVLDPRHADGPEAFRALGRGRAGASRVLRASYLYRGLERLARAVRPRAGGPVALESLAPRVAPEAYERNLEAIAAWARERGVGLLFLALRDNPVHTEWLRAGVALLEEGRPGEAADALAAAAAKGNWHSDLARIHLGRAYRALGRAEEAARATLVRPYVSLHGGTPIRLEEEYRSILDRVAAAAGAEVVDAGAVLAEAPSDYLDFAHPDANGHRRIAAALRPRVEEWLAATGVSGDGRPGRLDSRHAPRDP